MKMVLLKLVLFLVVIVQLMNVAFSVDDGIKQEKNVDQWMALRNCENDTHIELFKEFSAFSRELISNCNSREQQWKLEQAELMSQALNQSHAQAAAECGREKLDLSLKLQYKEQELTKLQQKMQDQFVKYEALLEEIQISIIDKTSYENITTICKAIHNSKCVGVRCYDLKLAQDTKEHNYLTAIAMYEDLIIKLSPCLKVTNIHIQQLTDEKTDLHSKIKALEKPWFRAVRDGNQQLMRNLIAKGVNINVTDEHNDTALTRAFLSSENYKAITKLLIGTGAYLDAQNFHGDTALTLAARRNDTDICKMLLEAGADANIRNIEEDSALLLAVTFVNVEVIEKLLEKGADVNLATKFGNTPLHYAARFNVHTDIAKILVEHGANLHVKNFEVRTPLGVALFYNQTEMATYLKSIGAPE